MPGQRDNLHVLRKFRVRHVETVAGLGHEEFVPERLRRISAVEEARLENGRARELRLYAGRENFAARLPLQILAAADVVGVRVRDEDSLQLPALLVKRLAHPAPRVLIRAGVDDIDAVARVVHAYLRGTGDVIGLLAYLYELVHGVLLSIAVSSGRGFTPPGFYPKNLL